jgi:Adenine/guanine phosphoribosyltransferases and related PRPP-binding proteins
MISNMVQELWKFRMTQFLDGEKILIVDDLLATGGSAIASASLVERLGGAVVGFVFIICLNYLEGMNKLRNHGYNINCILEYY